MTVLIMVTVLAMLVIGLYASVRGGLLSASLQSRRVAAQYVAEAGLAETMETLRAGGFAMTSGTLTGSVSTGGTYTVEFNDTPPFNEYHSVNNLGNSSGAAESHRGALSVPPETALIIVRAEVDGVERVLEAVVSTGGGSVVTDNAIQSSGKILMSGNVKVDGVKDLGDPTALPGNIHSNGSSGTTIHWDDSGGATASITGNVGSLGGAVDLSGYIPGGGSPTTGVVAPFPNPDILGRIAASASAPAPVVNPFGVTVLAPGDHHQSGDLVINGDLDLDGATLYVDGNLQVNGSIKGDGTVFVSGQTEFYGDSSISASSSDKVAVMSHGSVTLSGFDGTKYLEAMAGADAVFAGRWSDLQMVLGDMQTLLNSSPIASLQAGGVNHGTADQMRRSIGQTNPGATYAGTEGDLVGNLSLAVQAQPPGPTRDFLINKLDQIALTFEGCMDNPLVAGLPNDSTSRQIIIDAWNSNPDNQRLGFVGIFDSVIDNGDNGAMAQLINITNQIDYDKVGSSYFQGLVYTNGFVHARNEVNIIGALMADGDTSLPTAIINGQTTRPGDLILEDGVKVTFVEEFFDGQGSGISIASSGTLGVETWLGR